MLSYPSFLYYNITTTRVIKELVPSNKYSKLLKGKIINFTITLSPPLISIAYVISCLTTSPYKLQRTSNSSNYSPLCYEPVVLSIKIKSPNSNSKNGEVQLFIQVIAYFNRLRQLIQNPVAITLPLLLITNACQKLYFASNLAHKILLINAIDISTTANIIRCYTILEALRVMFK